MEKGLNILGPIAVGPSSHYSQKFYHIFLYRPRAPQNVKMSRCWPLAITVALILAISNCHGRPNSIRSTTADLELLIHEVLFARGEGGRRFRNGHEKNRIIHHPLSLAMLNTITGQTTPERPSESPHSRGGHW